MGMDSITAGMAIAWAMECYEKGIITKKDTGGIEIDWGDAHLISELIRKIAGREGFGDLLAEGPLRAAERLGKGEEYVLHVKGQPAVGCDQRSKKGSALSFATSSRGADHLRGLPVAEAWIGTMPSEQQQKLFGVLRIGEATSTVGKAQLVIWNEHICAVADSLEICKFPTGWCFLLNGLRFREFSQLLSAATGIDTTENDMVKAGERIINIERAFNVREGCGRKDDDLPKRWIREPLPSGPFKGHCVTPEELKMMLDEYYELRGWDVPTGLPTKEKLEELNLRDIAEKLKKLNKLPTAASRKDCG